LSKYDQFATVTKDEGLLVAAPGACYRTPTTSRFRVERYRLPPGTGRAFPGHLKRIRPKHRLRPEVAWARSPALQGRADVGYGAEQRVYLPWPGDSSYRARRASEIALWHTLAMFEERECETGCFGCFRQLLFQKEVDVVHRSPSALFGSSWLSSLSGLRGSDSQLGNDCG